MSAIPDPSKPRTWAFTSTEVREITGVSIMQINHWDRLGIAKPSLRPAGGTGSRRLYAPSDLAAVEIAHRLRATNISLDCLASAMRNLRTRWPNLAGIGSAVAVLVSPDGVCQQLAAGTDPAALLSEHRAAVILDLGGVIEDLRKRLALPRAAERPTPPGEPARRPQASAWGEEW